MAGAFCWSHELLCSPQFNSQRMWTDKNLTTRKLASHPKCSHHQILYRKTIIQQNEPCTNIYYDFLLVTLQTRYIISLPPLLFCRLESITVTGVEVALWPQISFISSKSFHFLPHSVPLRFRLSRCVLYCCLSFFHLLMTESTLTCSPMNQNNKISVCMVINVNNRCQETCFNGVNNSKIVNSKFYLCSVTSLQHFHMPPSFLSTFSRYLNWKVSSPLSWLQEEAGRSHSSRIYHEISEATFALLTLR